MNCDALAGPSGAAVLLPAAECIEQFPDVLIKGGRLGNCARADPVTVLARVRSQGIGPPTTVTIGPMATYGS